MNRPKGIYFILLWFFLAFSIQMRPFLKMIDIYKTNNLEIPVIWQFVVGGLFVFFVYMMIGLFQLQKLNRWIAIVFFAICTAIPIVNFIMKFSSINKNAVFVLVSLLLMSLNVLSIKYLLSTNFIKQSEEFNKEKTRNKFMLKVK